ncbi:hypothetical protein [Streptomyces tremellae]|uniref:Amine oxidase domain-containing protein n=1 Tax=Streptomyces tremellae TaxID=1124239 RepID=A0ABP7FRD9_9ACTN
MQHSVPYEFVTTKLADADAVFYDTANDGKPADLGPKLFAQQAFKQLPATRVRHLFGSECFLSGGFGGALAAFDGFESALRKLKTA